MQSTENLNVDTPEQIALEFPLAGIGSRFLAMVVDSLLQILLFVVLSLIFYFSFPALTNFATLHEIFSAILVFLVPFCVYWGYFACFEILWRGQTPGKIVAGIRVIHQTGRPMTAVEAIGRNLLRGIDIMPPPTYAVGLICMMCNAQSRRLGDFVAGTIVVHDKTIETVQTGWATAALPVAPDSETTKLNSEELVLIETYLSRRYDLDPSIRISTALQITAMIQQKTAVTRAPGQSTDDFLEAVAKQLRDTAALR
ncbi:MAG TPA: RDD family protein [Terriglobales bacterium]|nr:RDD family protein [Terriglobales bacterium]